MTSFSSSLRDASIIIIKENTSCRSWNRHE
jgi:hypothetical protein